MYRIIQPAEYILLIQLKGYNLLYNQEDMFYYIASRVYPIKQSAEYILLYNFWLHNSKCVRTVVLNCSYVNS